MFFLGAESDPDSSKHTGGRKRRRGGAGRRNINESGGKEKYWADVMLQMQNALVHVIGNGREGVQRESGCCKWQEDGVKLQAAEGEQQRGGV